QARDRRRVQRGSRSRVPVPAGLPALQPPHRWNGPRLV
ncbi:Mannonate dehydratase (EC 4.2.1.8), partial [Arthrobacter sp. DR-2P]